MKYFNLLFIFALFACSPELPKTENIALIPRPNQLEVKNGIFKIGQKISLKVNNEELNQLAENFCIQLKDLVEINVAEQKKADINLFLNETQAGTAQCYSLTISKSGIEIKANSKQGIFYGLQTLQQLFFFSEQKEDKILLPFVSINDSPRFEWRGIMLDESRHFFGVEKAKQLLDLMAFHKLNVFHWHLTDAPGWRIEIKNYPKLTSVGAIGNDTNPNAPAQFYTQNQISEIVKYAQERFIEVIPEIDMPGHATAANRSYPEFSGGGSDSHPEFTFNPGNELTYQYLTNILKEVSELFPSEYIHLGGDEVHFGNASWNTNKNVQQLMQKENLANLKEVESYFVNRMADSIQMLNKTTIGWDEVVDHNLPKEKALVMWWRHDLPQKLETALSKGYEVILCPRIPLYFDFVQAENHEWGRKWGGKFSTLELTYQFPPDTLPGFIQHENLVKGLQANIWTERIQNNKRLDFMTHPRLSALAEAAWTNRKNKNLENFKLRLIPFLTYFGNKNIYYFNPFQPELTPEPVGVDKQK